MESYNKLKTSNDILKYYKTILVDLKTKRFKSKKSDKSKFLDAEIEKVEKVIEECNYLEQILSEHNEV